MADRKSIRFSIPAVGAGAVLGETPIATPDDGSPRTVVGILATNQTKLVRVVLMHTGKPIQDIDCGVMAQQREFIRVNHVYPGGVQMSLDIRNGSVGALVAGADAVEIWYDV